MELPIALCPVRLLHLLMHPNRSLHCNSLMRQHRAKLLYSEAYADEHSAAKREKEIKGWRRQKQLALMRGEVSLR